MLSKEESTISVASSVVPCIIVLVSYSVLWGMVLLMVEHRGVSFFNGNKKGEDKKEVVTVGVVKIS